MSCILSTFKAQTRTGVSYHVLCCNDHPDHVCLTKRRVMIPEFQGYDIAECKPEFASSLPDADVTLGSGRTHRYQ